MKNQTNVDRILWFFFLGFALGFIVGLSLGFSRDAAAAEGSVRKDPIFKNNNGTAKDNLIVRDKDGRVVGYMVKDPILKDGWIYFPRRDPAPAITTSPGSPPATATDSVGE